jgi:hypothetical protein
MIRDDLAVRIDRLNHARNLITYWDGRPLLPRRQLGYKQRMEGMPWNCSHWV